LVLLIGVTEITFAYAYKIIYEIDASHEKYGIGSLIKAFNFFFEVPFDSLWAFWKNWTYADPVTDIQNRFTFVLLVILTAMVISSNVMLIYFLISAIIESYNKVSQNLKNQIHLSRAKILFENSLLFKRNEVFVDTRYVIKAQAERITGDEKSDWDGLTTAITTSVK